MLATAFVAATQTVDCSAAGVTCLSPTSKNPILPSVPELLYGGIAFLVLFLALRQFALPPLMKMMRERTERIANDLDSAEKARREAADTLEQYKKELADARGEAGRIIDEARAAAEQVRADLVARAEADAADVRSRNEAAVQAAQERARDELYAQVREIALDAVERVIGARADDRELNLRIIDQFIDELGASTGSSRPA